MSTRAFRMIADQANTAKAGTAQPQLLVYGWIYLIFALLTALAVYVMFTFPQGEI